MADASVTRRALDITGSRDATTGWVPSDRSSESTIKGSFDPATAREVAMRVGMPLNNIPYYTRPFYTNNYVRRGDHIVHSVIGEVNLVAVTPVTWLDQFVYYACQCEELLTATDRYATSGTWHTDSEAVKTDPRNRIKAWIDTYISYAMCDYQTMFAGIDYPMEREFIDNGLEIVSAIDVAQGQPEYTHDHYPYKFNETVTITNTAKDTATLTATNILESFEQAIRDVATDHPFGSIRRIRSSQPDRVNIGGMWLWQNTITIEYTRANDDFSTTYPRITYGQSGVPDGTWYWPNVTRIEWPNGLPDIKLLPPGRVGNVHQIMGDTSLRVRLYSDLDVANSTYTWERPQTATPKTDRRPWQIFMEMKHQAGIIAGDEPYQTLTFGANGPAFKVRLVDFTPTEDSNGNTLMVEFEEYVSAGQSGNTYKTRWGLS